MSAEKKILWLEDEGAHQRPHTRKLRSDGFKLEVARTVTEASKALHRERFDLLILDVMVPTRTKREEEEFPPEKTDLGLKMGLYFYEKLKPRLDETDTKVLVFTVRLDSEVRKAFHRLGLPEDHFATKVELRRVDDFADKVRELLGVRA